jgi:hypothetical protein
MKTLKKHLKLIIGIAVLVLVGFVFFFATQSGNLENGNMHNWKSASQDRRARAIQILTADEEYTDLMVACLDKISTLPESADMTVKDASSLCFMGIQLKDNI